MNNKANNSIDYGLYNTTNTRLRTSTKLSWSVFILRGRSPQLLNLTFGLLGVRPRGRAREARISPGESKQSSR